MITVKQLKRGINKYWVDRPDDRLSTVELLMWYAAQELADFVELSVEPEDFARVLPQSYTVLWGFQSYLGSINQLPPHSLAHLFLMFERTNWGLTARGDDTKRASNQT